MSGCAVASDGGRAPGLCRYHLGYRRQRVQAHGAERTTNGVVAPAQRFSDRPRDDGRIDIVRGGRLADRIKHVDDGHLVGRAGEQDAVRPRGVDEEARRDEVVEDLFERRERGIEGARELLASLCVLGG